MLFVFIAILGWQFALAFAYFAWGFFDINNVVYFVFLVNLLHF